MLEVILFSAPYGPLTYSIPAFLSILDWRPGMRVLVPVGRGLRMGLVVSSTDKSPDGVRVRPVVWPVDQEPILDSSYLDMIRHLALRQADPEGKILGTVLPHEFKQNQVHYQLENGEIIDAFSLCIQPESRLQVLACEWNSGRMRVKRSQGRIEVTCRVVKDPPWPLLPSAKRQWQVMEHLWERGRTKKSELARMLGSGATAALQALQAKGLVVLDSQDSMPEEVPACFARADYTPGADQARAIARLRELLQSEKPATGLVHGVTGSGKTLVYLELARTCLESGRWVLLLAPEIAIAAQLFAQARTFFGSRQVSLFHGSLPRSERRRVFEQAAQTPGPACVVGTRSALFLPMPDPGLVVLDEEHDASFKQEERLTYHAKDLAWFRVRRSGGLLVLGSATPDIKTYFASQGRGVDRVEMKDRVGPVHLPSVELVDLTAHPANIGPLAPQCHQALMHTLEAGEQAIIMHNRRGYAPVLSCEHCGESAKCEKCQVSLTYHKARDRAVCHYCGTSMAVPLVCAHCGSTSFIPMGSGTEKLEEYFKKHLAPDTGILRLDRDTSRRQGSMEEILNAFSQGRAQVLVGTQMISKGHDFPGVTLVLVIDGDLGLSLPDYRATERTFQLLVQVSGRAGRREKPGTVFIQTRNPNHYCWRYVLENDYLSFYQRELELRQKFMYPPFCKLALIRLSFPAAWSRGPDMVQRFGQLVRRLSADNGLRVLGPAPAPLAKLKGRLRHQCLLKAQDWGQIRGVYHLALQALGPVGQMRVSLDLDPMNML